MSRQMQGMLWIPSIQEIREAQEKCTEIRSKANGKHCYMWYCPKTGEFYLETAGDKTHKFPYYFEYIPPWKDPYEIRQEIIDYVKQKVRKS